jgi:hypothetical protein
VIEYYHRTLIGEDTQGLDYLRRRHIGDPETIKTFQVGYCNGTLKKVLPKTAVPTLKKIGLLRADGTETFEGCIVIPVLRTPATSANASPGSSRTATRPTTFTFPARIAAC